MAVLTLPQTITATGMRQDALYTLLVNLVTVVNELVDDHATNKTTIDECRTAIVELIDDHATNIALLAEIKTAVNAIITAATSDSATNIAAVSAVAGSPAATLTAGDPTASAAALTNSTDLTLSEG